MVAKQKKITVSNKTKHLSGVQMVMIDGSMEIDFLLFMVTSIPFEVDLHTRFERASTVGSIDNTLSRNLGAT